VAHSEIAHEASAITKVLAPTLLNQGRNKVLVGLELDTLAPTQIDFKDMLFIGELRVRERESRELGRQGGAQHTVQLVDSLTLVFTKRHD
jgi:hypothetical protein